MRQLGSGVDGFDLLVADKNLYFKMISIKVSSHLTLIGSEILIVYKGMIHTALLLSVWCVKCMPFCNLSMSRGYLVFDTYPDSGSLLVPAHSPRYSWFEVVFGVSEISVVGRVWFTDSIGQPCGSISHLILPTIWAENNKNHGFLVWLWNLIKKVHCLVLKKGWSFIQEWRVWSSIGNALSCT